MTVTQTISVKKQARIISIINVNVRSEEEIVNILVTGGVGYIGSCLLSTLRKEEFAKNSIIRSLDNNYSSEYLEVKNRLQEDKRYQLVVGDITEKTDVRNSLVDIDAIVHLAAISGLEACMKDPKNAISTNIYGTQKILELAVKSDVEQLVFASSAAVYGSSQNYPISEEAQLKPLNLYGITKVAGEQLVETYRSTYGLCTTIFRLANVFGLGNYTSWNTVTSLFVKAAVEGKAMVIYGSGEQARNFVHVTDATRAIIRCLKAGKKRITGETFNIGSKRSISINRLAKLILCLVEKELGKSAEVIHAPPRLGETYAPNFEYSIAKAERILGYNPRVSLEEGISQLIHYVENL